MRDITQLVNSSDYITKKRNKGWAFRRLLSLLDRSLRSVAISLISGYQHYLSPKKGYSCTHRIVYGGDSCSEYVKKTLADKSLFETTLLSRQRLRACSVAYVSFRKRVVESKVPAIGGPACGDPDLIIGCCTALGVGEILRRVFKCS